MWKSACLQSLSAGLWALIDSPSLQSASSVVLILYEESSFSQRFSPSYPPAFLKFDRQMWWRLARDKITWQATMYTSPHPSSEKNHFSTAARLMKLPPSYEVKNLEAKTRAKPSSCMQASRQIYSVALILLLCFINLLAHSGFLCLDATV